MRLEELQPDAIVPSILPDALVTVVSVSWQEPLALALFARGLRGRAAEEFLVRHKAQRPDLVESGCLCSFYGDGALFRPAGEAHQLRLAHPNAPLLTPPHIAGRAPIPHLATAVRESPSSRSSHCSPSWPTTPSPARPSRPDCC